MASGECEEEQEGRGNRKRDEQRKKRSLVRVALTVHLMRLTFPADYFARVAQW